MHTPTNVAKNSGGRTRLAARQVLTLAGLLLLVPALFAACAGDDEGLTRAEVEEIVREEVAEATSSDDLPGGADSVASTTNDAPDTPAMPVKKLKIGSAFNIPPMWHPLRLAEDYATADILTGGRIVFGIGRGYHTREVEVFGAPLLDKDANRELFEEQIEVIFKAFNEPSFSHHRKYYDIPPKVPYRGYELEEITLVPRPLNLPVECWQPIVSASERGLNLMAKYGIKGVIGGGAAPGGAADKVVDAWQRVQANHGRELPRGGDLNVGFSCYIADTEEQAIEEATKYFEENVKMFAPLGFVGGLTDEQISATADPLRVKNAGLPTLKDAIKAGSWLCGPPDLIIEKLMDVQKRLPGLEQITLNNTIGMPQNAILEQLDRFASDVMPAFKEK